MKNSNEHLTNGGKSHVCGQVAVHNNPKGEVSLCPICDMAVDSPSNEHQVPEWEKNLREDWYKTMPKPVPSKEIEKFSETVLDFWISQFRSHHAHLKERVMDLKIREGEFTHDTEGIMYRYNKAYSKALSDVISLLE